MIARWLAVTFAISFGIGASCASQLEPVTSVPDRLTPQVNAIVIELDAPDWIEVCLRRFPPMPQRYSCFYVGDLRQMIQPTLRADN